MQLTGVPQSTIGQDGTPTPLRQGRQLDLIVSELQGRFFESAFRGQLYSGGMALTSINSVLFATQLDATAKPIVGIWNPPSSGVIAVPLQAQLGVVTTAATSTGPGPFVWAISTGNNAVTTGAAGLNRKTLVAQGGQVKDMTNVALTGLTNNPVVKFASSLGGGSASGFSFVATAAGPPTINPGLNVENFDGSILVYPGCLLALFASTTAVAHSAASGMLWAELPFTS